LHHIQKYKTMKIKDITKKQWAQILFIWVLLLSLLNLITEIAFSITSSKVVHVISWFVMAVGLGWWFVYTETEDEPEEEEELTSLERYYLKEED